MENNEETITDLLNSEVVRDIAERYHKWISSLSPVDLITVHGYGGWGPTNLSKEDIWRKFKAYELKKFNLNIPD